MSPVTEIMSPEQWRAELAKADGRPVFVEFYAPVFPPSMMVSGMVNDLSGRPEFSGVVSLRVDITKQQDIAEQAEIRALPALQIWQNGQKVRDEENAIPPMVVSVLQQAADMAEN